MNEKGNPGVATKSGKIAGSFENGLYVFKGIPYAAPPVDELRWMPPQPVKKWDGVLDAKIFGAIAPQTVMPLGPFGQEPQPQSEDCLFLNVWTPGLDKEKRPVMAWKSALSSVNTMICSAAAVRRRINWLNACRIPGWHLPVPATRPVKASVNGLFTAVNA
jgi:hypothetical protein